jgi:UDP-N-acetylmuramate-alanine ligase
MPGRHNALNATVGDRGRDASSAFRRSDPQGLAGFGGVKRRFTRTGDWNGVTCFDDYGHHRWRSPRCSRLRASRQGQVIAVMQPHRYTRLVRTVRSVLYLLQRRRRGDHRARLSGRRGADRRRGPLTRWWRGCARAGTARRHAR